MKILDSYGPKGNPTYYTIQEEREHALSELLMSQKTGECTIRIKGNEDSGDPYLATVPPITFPVLDPDTEAAFREASAKVYCRSLQDIEQERKARLDRFLHRAPSPLRNRS